MDFNLSLQLGLYIFGIDDFIIGSAVGGLLGLGGSAIMAEQSRKGQSQANAMNIDIARNQYNWAAQDLKNAGLNPILALSKGISGASPPPMVNPYANSAQIMAPALTKAISSGTDVFRAKNEADNIKSQIEDRTSQITRRAIQNNLDESVIDLNRITQGKIDAEQAEIISKKLYWDAQKFYIQQLTKKETHLSDTKRIFNNFWRKNEVLFTNILKGLGGDENEISSWAAKTLLPFFVELFKVTSPIYYPAYDERMPQ